MDAHFHVGRFQFSPASPAFDSDQAATRWLLLRLFAFDFAQAATRWFSDVENTVFQFLLSSSLVHLLFSSYASPYPLP
ncbi:MAG: hypothetical protein LWX70_11990, partial [Sphingobacteriia bacterium]|nr:hypothetical protein [Sphingobacteriia bacterium]